MCPPRISGKCYLAAIRKNANNTKRGRLIQDRPEVLDVLVRDEQPAAQRPPRAKAPLLKLYRFFHGQARQHQAARMYFPPGRGDDPRNAAEHLFWPDLHFAEMRLRLAHKD